MGWTYEGVYRHQIGAYTHEGCDLHEGYLSKTASGHHRSVCECGWRGHGLYEDTDEGEDSAQHEWSEEHIRPLLRAEAGQQPDIPADALLELTWALRDRAGHLTEQPDRLRGMCEAVEAIEALLDQYAVTSRDRARAQARAAIEGLEPTAWTQLAWSVRDGDMP